MLLGRRGIGLYFGRNGCRIFRLDVGVWDVWDGVLRLSWCIGGVVGGSMWEDGFRMRRVLVRLWPRDLVVVLGVQDLRVLLLLSYGLGILDLGNDFCGHLVQESWAYCRMEILGRMIPLSE